MLSDAEAHILETIARHCDECRAASYIELCACIANASCRQLDAIDVSHVLYALASRPSPLVLLECGDATVCVTIVPHLLSNCSTEV